MRVKNVSDKWLNKAVNLLAKGGPEQNCRARYCRHIDIFSKSAYVCGGSSKLGKRRFRHKLFLLDLDSLVQRKTIPKYKRSITQKSIM